MRIVLYHARLQKQLYSSFPPPKTTAMVQSRLKNREAKAEHMTGLLYEDIAFKMQVSQLFKHKAFSLPIRVPLL